MSGIFGIINLDKRPVLSDELERMKIPLLYRAKEGHNTLLKDNIGVGFVRMVTTDESVFEKGVYEDDRYILTVNARIDNREELAVKFGFSSAQLRDMPDGLLVFEAFKKWHQESPKYLIGDFVFGVWDKQEQTFFLIKDHVGIKACVYAVVNHTIVFASEPKAIRALGLFPTELHDPAILELLLSIELEQETTFFKNIYTLPSGHVLEVSAAGKKQSRYWNPVAEGSHGFKSFEEYAEGLKEVFIEAVHCRVRGDQSIGTLLSGGLDSSAITGVLAQQRQALGKPVFAASAVLPLDFQGYEKDERFYIETVLKKYPSIQHKYVTAEELSPFHEIEREFERCDVPPNRFYYLDNALYESLQKDQVRTVLSGVPGDGIVTLQGYDILAHLLGEGRLNTAFRVLKSLTKRYGNKELKWGLKEFGKHYFPQGIEQVIRQILKKDKNKGLEARFTMANLSYLKSSGAVDKIQAYFKEVAHVEHNVYDNILFPFYKNARKTLMLELEARLAHHGMVQAYPFLDKRVIEYMLKVPVEYLLPNGWRRGLMRYAMDEIYSDEVKWRTNKTLFSPTHVRRLLDEKSKYLNLLQCLPERQKVDVEKMIHLLKYADSPAKFIGQYQQVYALGSGLMALYFEKWLGSEI